MKNKPECLFDIIVLEERSLVSTPPKVTSAVRYPSVPVGFNFQEFKNDAKFNSTLLGISEIFPLMFKLLDIETASLFGIMSEIIDIKSCLE